MRAGVAAAWLFALTPCLPRRGAFGDIDHNMTEVLAVLLMLLAADPIARHEETRSSGLRDPRLSPLLWASAVQLSLGFYTGLVLSAGIVAAALAARDLASPTAPAPPRPSAPSTKTSNSTASSSNPGSSTPSSPPTRVDLVYLTRDDPSSTSSRCER